MPNQLLERGSLVLFGAILAWFLQQYRIARSEDAALINEHIKDLEKFRDVAQEYWLTVPDPKLKDDPGALREKDLAQAARVRAAHAATTLTYGSVYTLSAHLGEEYKKLFQRLYETATGGSFESTRNGIEPERAIDVYDCAARLIHLLRAVRRDVLSLRRLLYSMISFASYKKLANFIFV